MAVTMKGGASGGTIHSAMGLVEHPVYRKQIGNPHLLCLPRSELAPESVVAKTTPPKTMSYDKDMKLWRTRFAMSVVNEQTVRRSAYIQAQRGKP